MKLLSAHERRATATELTALHLAALAGKGHGLLMQNLAAKNRDIQAHFKSMHVCCLCVIYVESQWKTARELNIYI